MFRLNEYRNYLKGFSDLLNFAFLIDDGIALNKDGSLSASFRYQALDIFSATAHERNNISRNTNAVLSKFGSGWSIQYDAIRELSNEYPLATENHFKNFVAFLIDEERRAFFTQNRYLFQTSNFITLTYLPPYKTKSKLTNLMFDSTHEVMGDKILEYFKNKIQEFLSLGKNIFIDIQQLKQKSLKEKRGFVEFEDELIRFYNLCIVGNNHPIAYTNSTLYLDVLLGYDFHTGMTPKIDKKFIQIVAIDGYAQESYPNMLNALSLLDIEYRWNSKFIFLDNHEAINRLEKIRKKWKQKERGLISQIFNPYSTKFDHHAVDMVSQTDNALMEVNSGLLVYGYHASNIVIFNENQEELIKNGLEVKRIIEQLGFKARIEDINATEAYLGSLPAHIVPNIRRNLISSMNLAHLLPLSTLWNGARYNENDKFPPFSPPLLYGLSGSSLFRLNLHVNDIGHTLIFGPTGSGKSTILALIIASFQRYENARIFAFDKGKSLYPLCLATNAEYYDIGSNENKLSFAPLSRIETQNDKLWVQDWIILLLNLQNIKPSPQQIELIHHALELHVETNAKSLTDFISSLQDSSLRSALNHYSISGSMGHLLDAQSDTLNLSSFSVFEIEELMNLRLSDAIPVLLYLFHLIEKSLDGSPTLLVLDEAWIMLSHEVFRSKIKEWLKVLRKANCSVVMATQSLSDASKSGILDILQESAPTKIFLPNPQALNRGNGEKSLAPYDFYTLFGLNHVEINTIAGAKMKKEYYYKSPYGSRLFELALGEFGVSFLGASSKQDMKKIDELRAIYGNSWIKEWLKYRKIDQHFINFIEKYEKN